MISEFVTCVVLAAAAKQDYRIGRVHNLAWITGAPTVFLASFLEYGSFFPPLIFGVWFMATAFMAGKFTNLGRADVYCFGVIGLGSTVYPWKTLFIIAVSTVSYSYVWSRRRGNGIRLIPALFIGYVFSYLYMVAVTFLPG